MYQTDDVRIDKIKELLPPIALLEKFPLTKKSSETVFKTRKAIQQILHHNDKRLLVIVGPCSIHDPEAAIEYGKNLLLLKEKYEDTLEIVMRVYFEKPRTRVGWKGLINDPFLDNSFRINDGLRKARALLLALNDVGMPTSTEYLDMITPQYIADLISWGAIGARTTESQVHRELASGLSCPVGFKNGTDGTISIAIDAISAASHPHRFLSVTKWGHSAIVETTGNKDCHLILRGGQKPNYDADTVDSVSQRLDDSGLTPRVMVDFSHANSEKQFKKQLQVGENIAQQIASGSDQIFGVMIESHLIEGKQALGNGDDLVYGQSITDGCIGWSDTENMLQTLSSAVQQNRDQMSDS